MKANTGVHEREGYFVGLPGFDVHSQATRGMNKNMLQVDKSGEGCEVSLMPLDVPPPNGPLFIFG